MIRRIRGEILEKGPRHLVIETAGLAYKVFATSQTVEEAPKIGGQITLWTHHALRENAAELFAFAAKEQLDFFELLLTISGIGPKTALAIINVAPMASVRKAVSSGNALYLSKTTGLGRKTAEKLVRELKDKIGVGETSDQEIGDTGDAIDALKAIGYGEREAREAVREVPEDVTDTGERVKRAIKNLSKK